MGNNPSHERIPESVKMKTLELAYQDAEPLTFVFDDTKEISTKVFWPYRNDEKTAICSAYMGEDRTTYFREFSYGDIKKLIDWLSGVTMYHYIHVRDDNDESSYAPTWKEHSYSWVSQMEFLHLLGLEDIRQDYSECFGHTLIRTWNKGKERKVPLNIASECIHLYAEKGLGSDTLLNTCFLLVREDMSSFTVDPERLEAFRRSNMFELMVTVNEQEVSDKIISRPE
jgi:hypothetical protein